MTFTSYRSVNFLAFIIISFLLFSCSDDADVNPMENPMEEVPEATLMTAVIDGEPWEANTYGAIVHNNFIHVGGEVLGRRRIDLVFNGTTSEVYSFNPEEGNLLSFLESSGLGGRGYTNTQAPTEANFGTANLIEINRTNETVSGTFESEVYHFTLGSTIAITEGRFSNIPIIRDRTGGGADEFYTNVGDVPFHALYTSSSVSSNGELAISASAAMQAESFTFRMPSNTEVGTYDLGAPFASDYSAQYFSVFGNGFFPARSGQITVLENDVTNGILKAEFSFETDNYEETGVLEMSEGSFQVSY